MTTTAAEASALQPFRMFWVRVARVRRLSPSFVRLTFTGPDLDRMADQGLDQRIKLILPDRSGGFDLLPRGDDWRQEWRRLPSELRNPLRSYTVRHVRPTRREVDLDMVLHRDHAGAVTGPAARFALHAAPGDEAVLLGPDRLYPGRHGGREFRPPSAAVPLCLAADETGVPAVANIVRSLPRDAVGHVLLETPHPDDRFDLGGPDGVEVTWIARGAAGHGSSLLRSVCTATLPAPAPDAAGADLPTVSDEADGLLWQVPHARHVGSIYAWIAGEAATVRAIRRHLVNERGHDRRTIAFMAYWRMGRAGS